MYALRDKAEADLPRQDAGERRSQRSAVGGRAVTAIRYRDLKPVSASITVRA